MVPLASILLSIDSIVDNDSIPLFDIGIPALFSHSLNSKLDMLNFPVFIAVLIAIGIVCFTDCSTPPNALPTPRLAAKLRAESTSLYKSEGINILPLALLIYLFVLCISTDLSSETGINLLNNFEFKNPSTCLIPAAVFISTSAPFNELELFVSKSRLIYLPSGITFGLFACINTPV